MTIKLLTEHHLEFLSLKGGCTGLSESIHVKMPNCWKSHVVAQLYLLHVCDKRVTFYGIKCCLCIYEKGIILAVILFNVLVYCFLSSSVISLFRSSIQET